MRSCFLSEIVALTASIKYIEGWASKPAAVLLARNQTGWAEAAHKSTKRLPVRKRRDGNDSRTMISIQSFRFDDSKEVSENRFQCAKSH